MSPLLDPGLVVLALFLPFSELALIPFPAGSAEVPAGPVESRLKQVAPLPPDSLTLERSPGQERAVVLIHGLNVHLVRKSLVDHPSYRCWQEPDSRVVRHLAPLADVFSLAYSQNAPVEQISELAGLPGQIDLIRRLGYREIVLIGHSAGALIARQFVEDHPDAGVTKVIQVCAPNTGSAWAKLPLVRANQASFMYSMTCAGRQHILAQRAGKRIPAHVEFACVLGSCKLGGDGVVLNRNQWSEELQQQGIPVIPFHCNHYDAMILTRSAELLAQLVREALPRWDAEHVAAVRKQLIE
jgi:hypothetical protein